MDTYYVPKIDNNNNWSSLPSKYNSLWRLRKGNGVWLSPALHSVDPISETTTTKKKKHCVDSEGVTLKKLRVKKTRLYTLHKECQADLPWKNDCVWVKSLLLHGPPPEATVYTHSIFLILEYSMSQQERFVLIALAFPLYLYWFLIFQDPIMSWFWNKNEISHLH